jgi:hypothetical protein
MVNLSTLRAGKFPDAQPRKQHQNTTPSMKEKSRSPSRGRRRRRPLTSQASTPSTSADLPSGKTNTTPTPTAARLSLFQIRNIPAVIAAHLVFAYLYIIEAYEADRVGPAFFQLCTWNIFPGLWMLKDAGLRGLVEFDYPRYIQLYKVVRAYMVHVWGWLVLKLNELDVHERQLADEPAWFHIPGLARLYKTAAKLLRCFWWAVCLVPKVYKWCKSGDASALWHMLPLSLRGVGIFLAVSYMVNGKVEAAVVVTVLMGTTGLMGWWM